MTSMGAGALAGDLRRAQRAIQQLRQEVTRLTRTVDTKADVSDLAAMQTTAVVLESQAPAVDFGSESDGDVLSLGTLYVDSTATYLYAVYGTDALWQAYRWDGVTRDTITGSGSRPVAVDELEGLAWPT